MFNWTVFLFAWINQELKWLFPCSNMTEQGMHMRLPFESFVVEVVFRMGFEGGEGNNSADADWKIFLSCLKYNMKWTMKLTSHNSLQRSAGLNWFHVLATKYSWSKWIMWKNQMLLYPLLIHFKYLLQFQDNKYNLDNNAFPVVAYTLVIYVDLIIVLFLLISWVFGFVYVFWLCIFCYLLVVVVLFFFGEFFFLHLSFVSFGWRGE